MSLYWFDLSFQVYFRIAPGYPQSRESGNPKKQNKTSIKLLFVFLPLFLVSQNAFSQNEDRKTREDLIQAIYEPHTFKGIDKKKTRKTREDLIQAIYEPHTFKGIDKKKTRKTREDLIQAIYEGVRDFSDWNLEGADLNHMWFIEDKYEFKNTSFKGANLKATRFNRQNMQGVNMNSANMEWVDLSWSDIRGADMRTELEQVNLYRAKYDASTKFPPNFKPEEHDMEKVRRSCLAIFR